MRSPSCPSTAGATVQPGVRPVVSPVPPSSSVVPSRRPRRCSLRLSAPRPTAARAVENGAPRRAGQFIVKPARGQAGGLTADRGGGRAAVMMPKLGVEARDRDVLAKYPAGKSIECYLLSGRVVEHITGQ